MSDPSLPADLARHAHIRVFKYPLPVDDYVAITMPAAAEVLTVQVQNGRPYLWAKVDTRRPAVTHGFYVVGTGHPFPVLARAYVGTFQLEGGGLVFHVFTAPPAQG